MRVRCGCDDAFGCTPPPLNRSAQRFQGFVACIIGGAALMAIALFLFLPVVLLFPAKFALTFTLGSFLIQAAFALLRGPAKHLRGMFARERVVGTVMYLASMGEQSCGTRAGVLLRGCPSRR